MAAALRDLQHRDPLAIHRKQRVVGRDIAYRERHATGTGHAE